MYLVSLWSFESGFLNYVNRSELLRLENLNQALQNEYAQQNSWEALRQNKNTWQQLVSKHALNQTRLTESTLLRSKTQTNENPLLNNRLEKIILLDEQQQIIHGQQASGNESIFQPIMQNNRIVGYLGINKRFELTHELDQIFSRQQQQNFIWIALGAVLISIAIALPFSTRLIKPLQNLLANTDEISKGNFGLRVETTRKDEIGQLAKAFNNMSENLQKQQALREQWLADISHELRTPLAVTKAEIEAIMDGIRELDLDNIASINQELDYLNKLVQDLHQLSHSDIQALPSSIKPENIEDILTGIFETFSVELSEKHLQIQLDSKLKQAVPVDKNRLTQVFINLLQNNLRYCPAHSRLEVNIQLINENILEIKWQDNGPGVNEENLGKLFDRLYREDSSRSSETKGSGLGLSISKQIIENHKGSISAYLSPLGGLGILIHLPVNHYE